MSYQVLARKCRPVQFADVIGQEHVTQTLRNAISANRIAHAYMFTGSRGVGKTTTARLLAKALNCVNGPTPNPCGECSDCKEISEGASLDVIEVDGASNNGVEQVRDLTDTIKYNSSRDKYKVYIIDEVHMLSIAAFNALLKNLEEPPPKVVFIFATTEIHKVPITIQSRCQQFIFNLIKGEEIEKRLSEIINKEGFSVEEGVLNVVAKASGGSMRDAESILEKVMTFCGKEIKYEEALDALGLVSEKVFFTISEAVITEDTAKLITIFSEVMKEGRNLDRFIKNMISFFRNLLILKAAPDLEDTMDLNPGEKDRVRELVKDFREPQLLFIIEILCDLESSLKTSMSPEVLAEVAFIKISHSKNVLPIEKIIKKLDQMESSLKRRPMPEALPKKKIITQKSVKEKVEDGWQEFLNHLSLKGAMFLRYIKQIKPVYNEALNEIELHYSEADFENARIMQDSSNVHKLKQELRAWFNHAFEINIQLEAVPEPIAQEPIAQEPIVQEPIVQEPIVQEPIVQEPIVQEPIVQEPIVQEPIVQEPIVQEPIVQEPIAEIINNQQDRSREPEIPAKYKIKVERNEFVDKLTEFFEGEVVDARISDR